MQLSEIEYYLLSELITMPDRITAQKAELLCFAKSHNTTIVWDDLVKLLEESEDEVDFHKQLLNFIDSYPGVTWHVSEKGIVSASGLPANES